MKLKFLLLLTLLLLQPAVFGQKKLVAKEISFEFLAKGVDGTLGGFSSESVVYTDDLTKSVFKGSVQVTTLKTGNFLRDWSLKGRKYFDEDNFPEISFESSAISVTDKGYQVEGTLFMKGVSKPLSISFQQKGDQLIGTATLNSVDYGITILKKKKEDNTVRLKLVFQLQ
ncbi:MAG: YceI family protein [Bacteroidota bacterium]